MEYKDQFRERGAHRANFDVSTFRLYVDCMFTGVARRVRRFPALDTRSGLTNSTNPLLISMKHWVLLPSIVASTPLLMGHETPIVAHGEQRRQESRLSMDNVFSGK